MATITIKNIPDDVYESLKLLAEANRRSINSEVIVLIEEKVTSRKIVPEEVIARARQLREKTSQYLISDEDLKQAKETGRL